MQTLDPIFEEARRLPLEERRRLVEKLQDEIGDDNDASEQTRMAALDKLLALAGTAHSDHTDVSSNKYKHFAEIYADKR